MAIVLGIDPGSRITGVWAYRELVWKIKVYCERSNHSDRKKDLAERLGLIYDGISEIVRKYQPTEFAVEKSLFQNRRHPP